MSSRAFVPRIRLAGLVFWAAACARTAPDPATTASRSAATVVDRGGVMAADALRTGWYSDEPLLDPLTVGSPNFGQIFDTAVDGRIYAQPLYANGILLVVTETNRIYGLDAVTGAVNWTRQVATPWQSSDIGCGSGDASNTGITGTPAIDPTTQTAYFFSKTYVNGQTGPALWAAHAVDLSTGAERANFPVTIAGSADNDASQIFNPTQQLQRPGLLLLNGVVYAAFGSHCDFAPYAGWIVGVSTTGVITARWTTEAGASKTAGAGIWMSGGGLVSDGDGQIVFASGNDGSLATTPIVGHQPPASLGEAVIRLNVQADGTLAATDFFSPVDTPVLNQNDADLGAGAPMALPATFGTAAHPKLLAVGGKQGYLYLFDGSDLGGYLQGPGRSDQVLQRIGPNGGIFSKPSVWPGDGGYVYIPVINGCAGPFDVAGCLRAYQYGATSDGTPSLSLSAESTSSFGYGSSAVIVTSDGTRSGSALLWSVWLPNSDSTTAQLRAYDALPVGDALNLRYLAGLGATGHFTPPAVGAGRIYIGTADGHVMGFGVTSAPALRTQGLAFAPTTIGDTAVSNVQATTSGPVEVIAFGVSGDFTLAASAPSVPFTAPSGDAISIPITFRPTVEGAETGTLRITTDQGIITLPLTGVGQSASPQLTAAPSVVTFAPIVMGTTAAQTVLMTNVSGAPMTISASAPPSAPFSATGLPSDGTVVPVGGSFTVTLTFAPTNAGSSSSSFDVTAAAAVAIEGSALTGGKLRLESHALDMGSMTVGTSMTSVFQIANTGDQPVTIETFTPPSAPAFVLGTSLAQGTIIAPGTSVQELIRVSPTVTGPTSDAWQFAANDGQGPRVVTLTVNGVAARVATASPSPSPDAGTEATTVESNEPTVANETEEDNPGASDEVVGHACSAAGNARSPRLLGLGLVAAALVSIRRRRGQ
ncbi:MAG TPA: choice-of-anchor D domain-containing protein [Polyangia bacterium]|nr:choice-of-anchor D domain-containing protein [Polyangia bacterium]